MRSFYLILLVLACSSVSLLAQDNVGIGTLTPNPNAALDIESNDKGLLIPRLDPAQRAAIQLGLGAAETGLLVFDPVDELFYYWDNTQAVWVPFTDDQNIDSVVLNADTTLTVYIENGASATVDVRPLINDPDFDPTNEIQDLAMNATLDSLLISLGGSGVALTDLDRQDLIYDAIADSLLITNGAGIALDSIDNQGIDSFSISGTVLTVHIENGSPASIDLAGLPTIQDLDSAILNPDSTLTIYIEAALPTTVDLSSLFDNTDAQTLSLNATGTELSISNGNTVTLVDADSTNELQDLSLNPASDSLLISNGQGILLSTIDNQNIDSFVLNGDSTLTVFIQNGSAASVNVSSLFDNTDDQNITSVVLNADSTITVNIENGTSASVDVSSLFDNTDDQDITSVVLNADSTLTVNIENGASASVDLSSVFDNTDNQNIDSVTLNGTVATVFIEDGSSASVDLASLINDADADPTNEFQNLSFNGSGDSLLISNGIGVELAGIDNQNIDSVILNADSTITVFIEDGLPATVNVASLFDNTDAQTLTLNATGTELSISNGNTVTLVDADSTNELQSLIVDRITDSLYISGLSGDTLMGIDLNDVITCVIPPQNLTYAIMDGDTLEIDIEGGDSVRVDLSQFLDNTDNQDITSVVLNADSTITVNIQNGASATVDVAAIFDNTDDQNLDSISLVGTVATVFIEGGASASIDLASLVDDADADPTNELQDLSFNGASDSLLISSGLGVALSGIDNQDITSIVLNGDSSLTVNIEDGASATVDLTSLFDNTDDQDITSIALNADSTITVNIENGASASVDISSAFDNTDDQDITSIALNADSTITVNIENGASASVDISSAFDNTDNQNISSVVLNADSTITVNIENGTSATVDISSAFDNTDDQNITSVVLNADSTLTVNIENGTSATVDLTSAFDNTDNQNIDSVVLNGSIATVYIEGGSAASVDLASLIDDNDADPNNELNTSITLNGTDLEVTDAGGTIITDLTSLVDDADADPSNELQDLSINATNDSILISNGQGISLGSIDTDDQNLDSAILNPDSTLSIFIQDGASASVDLSSVFDNTDAQTLSLNATGTELSISNGNTVTLVDADSTNELQTLLVDRITDSLYISGSNGDTLMGIDLNDVITCVIPPQNLTYAIMDGDTLEIDIEGGDSVRVDLSQFLDNTDNQDISSVVLNADSTITVNIQNGASATVDVAAIFDNTDDQNIDSISLVGTVATVFIENGASASINLASLVDDADADPTNELTTGVVLNGTDLEVTDAGGTITTDLSSLVNDADADPTNEYNTSVILNGTDLEISDAGGTITTDLSSLVNDADADPTNELQDLSINATNDSILISNGVGIPASGIPLSSLDTDEQNLDSATLTGSNLTIYIENGSPASVDLIDLQDADWFVESSGDVATNINQNIYTNGFVGIGNNSPGLALDIAGDIAFRELASNTSTNALSNFFAGTSNTSFLTFNGQVSDFTINTIAQPSDGKLLVLQNATSFNMTLRNESATAIGVPVRTMTGSDLILTGQSTVTLIYSASENRWIVLAFQDETTLDLDAQTLSLINDNQLTISNGNTVTLVDADSTNELQTLIVDRITDSLYISGTNGDTLMGIDLNDVITCVIPPQNLTYATLIGDTLEIDIEGGDSVRVDLSSLGSNDLDDAYDQGGPGVGRIIQADSGPVEVIGGDGIVVSTAGLGIGTPIPNIPNGTPVMYFSPSKGAFRAGGAANNRWDDASVGTYSWAGGNNSLASAPYTFAWGNGGSASAENAISLGAANTVFGVSSIALGTNNQIGGDQSVILGTNSRIDEFNTVILGPDNYARRRGSIIIGEENTTNGNFEYVIGADNIVSRTNGIVVGFNNVSASEFGVIIGSDNSTSNLSRTSYVLGNNIELSGSNEVGLGQYNDVNVPFSQSWDVRDRLFTIANGQNAGNRSNAMTILKSGNIGIGNTPEGLNPPNLLTLDNGVADPLKINNLATDNTLTQILVIDASGVVHLRDIGTLPIPAPGPGTPSGLSVADINTLQQTIQQQQGQIDALIQQNQDLLFRIEQIELGNNPSNP